MASTFFDRIDMLDEQVGHGNLSAEVEVDQVYAHYQEVGEDLEHPRGGEAYALRNSLYVPIDRHLRRLAERAITPDGSEIREGMQDVSEAISDEYHSRAPREFDVLRNSAHPSVTDDGAVIYDRPPHVHRLSEEELRDEHRRRLAGRGARRARIEHLERRLAE